MFPTEKKPLPGKKESKQNVPFVGVSTDRGSRPNNGGKPPIYRGPQMSTDDAGEPALDRSGYGDLGLGLVRQASHEALDLNGEGVDFRGTRGVAAPVRQDQPTRLVYSVFGYSSSQQRCSPKKEVGRRLKQDLDKDLQ